MLVCLAYAASGKYNEASSLKQMQLGTEDILVGCIPLHGPVCHVSEPHLSTALRQQEPCRQQYASCLLLATCASQQPDNHAANKSSGGASRFLQADARNFTIASDWLLSEAVESIGGVLQRPEMGLSAQPEVAQRIATLCRTLLAAAGNESPSGSPAVLRHVLHQLQPAVPACLR